MLNSGNTDKHKYATMQERTAVNPQKRELTGTERSEEVETIMGQTPPWVFRWGITAMALLVAALLIASWFIHWPETMNMPGIVRLPTGHERWAMVVAHIPAEQARTIQNGMPVQVALDIKDGTWGHYRGSVVTAPLMKDKTGLYPISIRVDAHAQTDTGHPALTAMSRCLAEIKAMKEMGCDMPSDVTLDVTVTITRSDRRLLQRIVGRE